MITGKFPRNYSSRCTLSEAAEAVLGTPPGRRQRGRPKGSSNRRNGHSPKTVGSDLGEITLATPRDRDGTF